MVPNKSDKSKEILKKLAQEYAGTTTALQYNSTFQLLIAVILSAQSTDQQVNKITRSLFAKYPAAEDFCKLTEDELAEEIRGVGLYRGKAKNILATARELMLHNSGQVPDTREKLMALPGVGRKTANVVLANAFDKPALGVDTHVLRVANRLGLAKGKNPRIVEDQLTELIPEADWARAHHWLIWHGRKVCKSRNPECFACFVRELCPSLKGGNES